MSQQSSKVGLSLNVQTKLIKVNQNHFVNESLRELSLTEIFGAYFVPLAEKDSEDKGPTCYAMPMFFHSVLCMNLQ